MSNYDVFQMAYELRDCEEFNNKIAQYKKRGILEDVFEQCVLEFKNIIPRPCPFCGERPYIVKYFDDYNNPMWWCECKNRDCTIHPYDGGNISEEEAIRRWNTRCEEI